MQRLTRVQTRLIQALVDSGELEEGRVRTTGPAAYRRLDRRGHALAYLRMRPKKRALRIDVPNLWHAPPPSRLATRSSMGWALWVRDHRDLPEAIAILRRTVLETERAEAHGEGARASA